ncbi:MAG TPA: hypothetical protein ENN69_04905, partial [Spirochaetia bacterium]|nr:hypothetical protein [Spirochaetia bacterium]
DNDIVLDFFAGSGTTGHAVVDFNVQNNKKYNFILIQINEPIDLQSPAGRICKQFRLSSITDIAKDRIKRAIKSIKNEKKDLFTNNEIDIGFKVFKLNTSHYKQWENYHGDDPGELEALFDEMKTPLLPNWKPDNLLTEIMLMEGFPLDSRISNLKGISKNKVHLIESESCGHRLLVCLDEKVYSETIKALDLADRDIFVCLDTAVTDTDKARLSDKGLIKTI